MRTIARAVFVAAVTSYLLGRLFAGATAHPETAVYGLTAAFGLNFLIVSWRSLWASS